MPDLEQANPNASLGEKFTRAVEIMARLRAPGGCPWDREQDFDSIKRYTVEETYEVLEAIENRDWQELPGELGDLLLQVLFYAQMAQEQELFAIGDVLDRLSNKLVERHPHVFGDTTASTSAEVLRNWENFKREERKSGKNEESESGLTEDREQQDSESEEDLADAPPESILEGISLAMPALIAAGKLNGRAAHAGFDWQNIQHLLAKLEEETEELRAELEDAPGADPAASRNRLEDEVGDMMFVMVNIARFLGLDAESALRKANQKFKRRFQAMEAEMFKAGTNLEKLSTDQMEEYWQKAKQAELAPPPLGEER